MAAYPQPVSDYYTYDQYLEINDAAQNVKYEYYHGEIFAMAGGRFKHNMIKDNINEHIRPRLRGKCYSMTSDMQLRVSEHAAFYPDVIVICGKPQFYEHLGKTRDDIVSKATIIFEVLSDSTKNYDKGGKADAYRSMLELKEHFLIDQDKPHVIHYYRQDKVWNYEEYDSLEKGIQLKSVDCELTMQEIYLDVEFE
ncbi:MAG: Uma2 family endonuclease [bacterium]